jgi:hypothetical protein
MFFGIGLAVQEEPGRTAAAAPSTSTSARMMMISFLLPPPARRFDFLIGFHFWVRFQSSPSCSGSGSRRHYVIIGQACAVGSAEKKGVPAALAFP